MKQPFAIITVVVLGLAAPVLMLAQGSKAEQEVRAVVEQDTQAQLKGDVATLDKIVADDFTRIRGSGLVLTKADVLEGFRAGKTKFDSMENSDTKVRIYGDTAVVTGTENVKGQFDGKDFSNQNRWTRVLVKRGGKWWQVSHQCTRVAR